MDGRKRFILVSRLYKVRRWSQTEWSNQANALHFFKTYQWSSDVPRFIQNHMAWLPWVTSCWAHDRILFSLPLITWGALAVEMWQSYASLPGRNVSNLNYLHPPPSCWWCLKQVLIGMLQQPRSLNKLIVEAPWWGTPWKI